MKFTIFQSVQEALTYGLLICVLVLNIIGLAISISAVNESRTNTREVEKQQTCLVSLFFRPNRAQLTLADITGCSNVSINK